jgi:hypothetical protein
MISASAKPDDVIKLANITCVKTMHTFPITYDRHHDRYGHRMSNFPASYSVHESSLSYSMDPDWLHKFETARFSFKSLFAFLLLVYGYARYRVMKVEAFDKRKRQEQRAMQNQEVDEVYNKFARFVLKDRNGDEITE